MTLSRPWRPLLILLSILGSSSAFAESRQITDAMDNQVTVPAHPLRIVTLSELDLDTVLALGIEPIGTTNGRGQEAPPHYLEGKISAQTRSVGMLDDPNLEVLLELQPDLILTAQTRPELLSILNDIAPTAVTYKFGESWQTGMQRTADILNRAQAGEALLADYHARTAAARERLAAHQGETFSIVRWNPKGPAYMLNDAFASRIIQDLGLTRPEQQQQPGTTHSMALSLESLEKLDAQWLVIGTLSVNGEAVDAMRQAESTPVFQQLGAIQNGHYRAVDGSLWTSVGGPLAARQVIEDVESLLKQQNSQVTASASDDTAATF